MGRTFGGGRKTMADPGRKFTPIELESGSDDYSMTSPLDKG